MPGLSSQTLERELETCESALLSRLRFLLPDSAKPGSSLFRTHPSRHGSGLVYFVPPASTELCGLASDCLRLRKRLSLPLEGTLPQTLLEAFSEHSGAEGAQRRLADMLLGTSAAGHPPR